MTQKDLAQRLFISDKAVSKWERGLSLPSISLLQPMADILGVTVTELLSGRYIREDKPLSVQEVDPLIAGALRLNGQGRVSIRHWGGIFILSLAMCGAGAALLWKTGLLWDPLCGCAWTPVLLAALFGVCFCFFTKEKLPAFYDQHRIGVYAEGPIHLDIPGICFNNRNWLHILCAMRVYYCAVLGGWLFAYGALRLVVSPLPGTAALLIALSAALLASLGGLFLAYIVGKKYQ